MHVFGRWKYAVISVALCAGCASNGGKDGAVALEPSQDEMEAKLRTIVEDDLDSAHKNQGEKNSEVVFKRPYYFKEYFEFPGTDNVYSLDFTQKESRTTPLTAELEVEKVRYATRMKTDRDQVQGDGSYLRSHGINYISYELRNGEWRRVGDLFLASATEENVDGEWKQIKEEKRPIALVESEKQSWFDKLKFWK